MLTMKVIAPNLPRLRPSLVPWEGGEDLELEADDALLQDLEITGVRWVMVTGSRLERIAAPAVSLEN